MATLVMMVSWEILNERNQRVFKNTRTMPSIIFLRVKSEAHSWVLAGAKHLGLVIPGE